MTSSEPLLRVVRGTPTPEELAALTAVVSATSATPTAAPVPLRRQFRQWGAPARNVRPALGHGTGAWRASGLPR